jgi:hypothetical protein
MKYSTQNRSYLILWYFADGDYRSNDIYYHLDTY